MLSFQLGGERTQEAIRPLNSYWSETGLRLHHLSSWINNVSCREDSRSTLGCINALEAIGRWRDLSINHQGQWAPRNNAIDAQKTEKVMMREWQERLSRRSVELDYAALLEEIINPASAAKKFRATDEGLMAGLSLNAYFSVIEDPHTYIIPRAFYEEVYARYSTISRTYGMIAKMRKGKFIVHKVHVNSAADRGGLKRGDEILRVNDTPTESLLPHELQNIAVTFSFGPIEVLVRRSGALLSLQIGEESSKIPNSEARILSNRDGLGLLTIHKFSMNSCTAVKNQVSSLKAQGMRGLLIDLRDNPGGYMQEALCIAGLFLPKGTLLLESRYLDAGMERERSFNRNPWPVYEGPVAVLINSGTASAAEIVAGVLRENNRATLVGERTFGKGTFQDGEILEDNDKLIRFRTAGVYYFSTGWSPQLVGIEPDVLVAGEIEESLREFDMYFSTVAPSRRASQRVRPRLAQSESCRLEFQMPSDKQLVGASQWITCARGAISQ